MNEKLQSKPQARRGERSYWMFGRHTVAAALANSERRIWRLLLTRNASHAFRAWLEEPKLELVEPRQIARILGPSAVHQGAAAEVHPLRADAERVLDSFAAGNRSSVAIALDRVTDPRNVGAVLRSAWVFGACAVLAPSRGAPLENGVLAKAASGGLDSVPYLRIGNLATCLSRLDQVGVKIIGLDDSAPDSIETAVATTADPPAVIVLGAEGGGLRRLTRERCHMLCQVPSTSGAPSLNVSNAAAVALYAYRSRNPGFGHTTAILGDDIRPTV